MLILRRMALLRAIYYPSLSSWAMIKFYQIASSGESNHSIHKFSLMNSSRTSLQTAFHSLFAVLISTFPIALDAGKSYAQYGYGQNSQLLNYCQQYYAEYREWAAQQRYASQMSGQMAAMGGYVQDPGPPPQKPQFCR